MREDFLTDLVKHFLDIRTAWIDGDDRFITETFETACDDLVDSFASGDIPAELRKVERVVSGQIAAEWAAWKKRAASADDHTLLPTADFWKAVERLEQAAEAAQQRPAAAVESISELKRQGVSDQQICVIYGWVDRRGAPEIWRLREELSEPGKHTAGWVNPVEKRRREREDREREISDRIRRRQTNKLNALTEPCAESVEQLVQQGLCVSQISKMRKCPPADVFAECDRLGLERPPLHYQDVRTRRAPAEPDVPESVARAFDAQNRGARAAHADQDYLEDDGESDAFESAASSEDGVDYGGDEFDPSVEAPGGAMTLEQEIISYHSQGMSSAEIAAAVSLPDREVTTRKVNAIVKRFMADPAAFAT